MSCIMITLQWSLFPTVLSGSKPNSSLLENTTVLGEGRRVLHRWLCQFIELVTYVCALCTTCSQPRARHYTYVGTLIIGVITTYGPPAGMYREDLHSNMVSVCWLRLQLLISPKLSGLLHSFEALNQLLISPKLSGLLHSFEALNQLLISPKLSGLLHSFEALNQLQ